MLKGVKYSTVETNFEELCKNVLISYEAITTDVKSENGRDLVNNLNTRSIEIDKRLDEVKIAAQRISDYKGKAKSSKIYVFLYNSWIEITRRIHLFLIKLNESSIKHRTGN